MAFLLNEVVPWGRTLAEYRRMFCLTDDDMNRKIASFGDGPASFNVEATSKGFDVTSYDIIYQFSRDDIAARIQAVCNTVMTQIEQNMDHYFWTQIRNPSELKALRMGAMEQFLHDYEHGSKEGRYVYHALPEKVNLPDRSYDLGLSSHFLLMYERLGYDFHIAAMTEMLILCREIRIFPICNLDGKATVLANDVITWFGRTHSVAVVQTDYQFQKSTHEMLVIKS